MTRMALVMLLFIAPASLAHATYRLHSLPGMIQLDQGSGSASEVFVGLTPHVVYGELDGQSVAAVVLVTTAGGTGSFFELAVMAAGASGPRNIATVVLGDRVRLLSLSLHDNEITVDLVRAGPYRFPLLSNAANDRTLRASRSTPHSDRPGTLAARLTRSVLVTGPPFTSTIRPRMRITGGPYRG